MNDRLQVLNPYKQIRMNPYFLRDLAGEVEKGRTCEECGKRLTSNKIFCSERCKYLHRKEWRCLECGAKTHNEASYCSVCKRKNFHKGRKYKMI